MRAWAPVILPLALAVILPLAGILLAANAFLTGDRELGIRISVATLLGAFIWGAILTA